jgi:hypothetical protein
MKSRNVRTLNNLDSPQITSVDRLQTGYEPSPSRSSTELIRATSEGWKQTYDSDICPTYLHLFWGPYASHSHTVNQPTFRWIALTCVTLSGSAALKLFIGKSCSTKLLISSGMCHWIFPNKRLGCRIESRFPNWECWHVVTQDEVSNI